jgi:hypothetical protein
MQVISKIVVAFLLFYISGCTPSKVNREQFLLYIQDPDNGLALKEEINDWVIELKYLPAEYFLLTQIDNNYLNDSIVNATRIENQDSKYFLLTISNRLNKSSLNKDVNSITEFNERMNKLMIDVPQSVTYITSSNTLKCSMHTIERSYNLSSAQNILLTFEVPENIKQEDFSICWNDQIFNFGKVYFQYKAKDFKNIPSIAL